MLRPTQSPPQPWGLGPGDPVSQARLGGGYQPLRCCFFLPDSEVAHRETGCIRGPSRKF